MNQERDLERRMEVRKCGRQECESDVYEESKSESENDQSDKCE